MAHLVSRATLVALVSVSACGAEPPPPPHAMTLIGESLPVRGFRQVDAAVAGTHDFGELDPAGPADGSLFLTFDAPGHFALAVRDPDGGAATLWPPSYVLSGPFAFTTQTRRVVCAGFGTVHDRGAGPRGRVLEYDRTADMAIRCWHSPRNARAWTPVTIAGGSGTPVARWLAIAAAEREQQDVAMIYHVRDSDYDDEMLVPFARPATDGIYEHTLTMTGATATVAQTDFEPNVAALMPMFQPDSLSCEGRCGWLTNGAVWKDCGATCGAGESCSAENLCATDACVPVTAGEACTMKLGAAPCGLRSDGCGGVLTCPVCPGGETCGASGITTHCGRKPIPQTIQGLKNRYQDDGERLCGVFEDPLSGIPVVMDTVCPIGTTCSDNLCTNGNPGPGPGPGSIGGSGPDAGTGSGTDAGTGWATDAGSGWATDAGTGSGPDAGTGSGPDAGTGWPGAGPGWPGSGPGPGL